LTTGKGFRGGIGFYEYDRLDEHRSGEDNRSEPESVPVLEMNLYRDIITDLINDSKGLGAGGCHSYLLKYGNYARRHKNNHRKS